MSEPQTQPKISELIEKGCTVYELWQVPTFGEDFDYWAMAEHYLCHDGALICSYEYSVRIRTPNYYQIATEDGTEFPTATLEQLKSSEHKQKWLTKYALQTLKNGNLLGDKPIKFFVKEGEEFLPLQSPS